MKDPTRDKDRESRELLSAALISAATLGQAWIGHHSNILNGDMTAAYQAAGASRTTAMEQLNRAGQLRSIDAQLFAQFTQSYSSGNIVGANFLLKRFRPQAKAATDAWIAMKPLKNPEAPKTPFQLKEYTIDEEARAATLLKKADELVARATALNTKQNKISLVAVLFTAVLFFCGIATNFEIHKIRNVLTGIGLVIFVVASIAMYRLG